VAPLQNDGAPKRIPATPAPAFSDRKSYALLLLEIAAQLPKSARLAWNSGAWNSVAMTGPVVAQRIRRVLKLDLARLRPLGSGLRALLIAAIAALILLTIAVDVRTLSGETRGNLTPKMTRRGNTLSQAPPMVKWALRSSSCITRSTKRPIAPLCSRSA
jgi:hypothetical protein